jgi:putative transposase
MDNLARRKQLRARGYDYSQAGFYFVTLCTQDRINLFGNPVGADSISAGDSLCARNPFVQPRSGGFRIRPRFPVCP